MAATALTCLGSIQPHGNDFASQILVAGKRIFRLLGLFFVFLMSGCATEPIPVAWRPPELPAPRVEPLSITVGVHYSESFQHGKHKEISEAGLRPFMHEPGSASVALFDKVLDATFERVVRIRTWPPRRSGKPHVDLVIVPRISDVSILACRRNQERGGPLLSCNTHITYTVDFFTAGGEPLYTWEFKANNKTPRVSLFSIFSYLDIVIASGLRHAAATLLIGLPEHPKIKAFLSENDSAPVMNATEDWSRTHGIAILPSAPDGESWAECMSAALREGPLPIVESKPFRDAVFPWFESSVQQPTTPQAWAQRLGNGLIPAGAREAGARYVLFVSGSTIEGKSEGPLLGVGGAAGAACFGWTSADRNTFLKLTLVDLMSGEVRGEIENSESGSSTLACFFVPVPIISMTETRACYGAAAKVREVLKLDSR